MRRQASLACVGSTECASTRHCCNDGNNVFGYVGGLDKIDEKGGVDPVDFSGFSRGLGGPRQRWPGEVDQRHERRLPPISWATMSKGFKKMMSFGHGHTVSSTTRRI